jgi:NhaC family Na+:H+ antiporter
MTNRPRTPHIWESVLPIITLAGLLSGAVYLFGEDASFGPNQTALMVSTFVALLVGFRLGFTWKELEEGMARGVSLASGAILILLTIGALIGTWILSGIVPGLIYWGLQILRADHFFAAACLICAVVSCVTGSSWTTVSTIGLALIGIASVLQVSLPVAAGAIISGAYFGDKLSPLSDTTNLAPAMTGTALFSHIRHMLWTTVPSFVIAVTIFSWMDFASVKDSTTEPGLERFTSTLAANFDIGLYLLVPPALVLLLVARRVPAFPALLMGALIGGLFACFFQEEVVLRFVGDEELPRGLALIKGFWRAMYGGFVCETGNAQIDAILTRGGMKQMLGTVWLILSAMAFGGVLERTGMLASLTRGILSRVTSTGSLICATLLTSLSINIVTSDQYMSIVIPGRMYRFEFQKRGLKSKNLSRCLEDAGTLTSPLVPWNTCGAFMAEALSVSTLSYLPFAFFNLFNPVISAVYGFTGFSIERMESVPRKSASALGK